MNYFQNLDLALVSNRRLLPFTAVKKISAGFLVLANMREFWNETLKQMGALTYPRGELAVGVKGFRVLQARFITPLID
jgi:hypothetical protein